MRQLYGFQDLKERQYKVEKALREIREIREAVASIANIKEKAVLQTFGIEVESDEDLEKDESEIDTDVDDDEEECPWKKFVFVLMVVTTRAALIRKSNFGGRATILIKHLKLSFLQHETVDQVAKTELSSKMDVLRSPILIYSYCLP